MTNGGARAVTMRKTLRVRADSPDTSKSPPGHTIVSSLTARPITSPTVLHATATLSPATTKKFKFGGNSEIFAAKKKPSFVVGVSHAAG